MKADEPVSTFDVKVEVTEETKTEAEKTKEASKTEDEAPKEDDDEWEEVIEKKMTKVEMSDGEEVELEEEVKVRRKK